ncbi:hypothetical protein QF037_004137 [Streptomyces canus]|uniref:hypothetical protein n=1 Tax=Streptomyces canus TaxID=58343 RepID=UPI002787C075|nr:hypothetical protein [Streptomyces canus]MDQ0599792.1 hypothetical protein [Streptomyces canus]
MAAGGERGRTAMRAAAKTNGTIRARLLTLLTLLALLITAFGTAAQAAPSVTSTDTQAAYLAAQLRTDPVYVTDQLPREIPQSTAPDFAKVAQRTGVPTYVLVLPAQATTGVGLLDAVHDRLGKDGLYVLIDESTVTEAKAYGVKAPAADAATVAFYELPYDAGPLRSFERFTDAIAQGAEKAAARAESAREKYNAGDEPADLYIGPSDRENQSTLTGMAITGVPLLMLLLVPYVRRWWRRRPGAAPRKQDKQAKGKSKSSGRWILAVLALATALAITLTAPLVFDQTRSSASPPPRAIDLNARLDRVAKGLAEDPVYADPESPRVLDTAQLAQLHGRIEKFSSSKGGGPVFVVLVPQIYEDESQGDEEAFTAAVRDKLGGKDGVFIVAGPLDGYINVFNYGLALDTYSAFFDLPESISYGDSKADEADDHLLGERLDDLMVILDKTARTDEPTTPGDPYPATDPIAEDELRPLYYGEFWSGLFLGVLAALLFFGLAAAVLGIVRVLLRRRNPEPLPTAMLPQVSPAAPSLSYLRETATTEIRAMTTAFGTGETADARSLDRYEATMVLVDEASAAGGSGEDLDVLRPAALVVIIVLARATRAALADEDTTRCCGVNPLHGPAKSSRHVRVSTEGNRRRMLPLCDRCLNDTAPNDYPALLLTLPAPDDDSQRTPYYEDDLLSAAPEGYTKLGRKVRESALAH